MVPSNFFFKATLHNLASNQNYDNNFFHKKHMQIVIKMNFAPKGTIF